MSDNTEFNKVEELTADRDLYKATCMADDALIKQLQTEVKALKAHLAELTKVDAKKLLGLKAEVEALRNPWISVDERLPDESGKYLCCHYQYRAKRHKYGYAKTFSVYHLNPDSDAFLGDADDRIVTHWMQVPPEPDKEDT